MKLLLSIMTLTLTSSMASAHLKIGTYNGTELNGNNCAVEIQAVTFEDNIKHPLNERVAIRFEETGFTLRHAPTIDLNRSKVTFEGDRLTGVKGSAEWTLAFSITMVHDEKNDGPSDFTLIKQNNKDSTKTEKFYCKGLVAP